MLNIRNYNTPGKLSQLRKNPPAYRKLLFQTEMKSMKKNHMAGEKLKEDIIDSLIDNSEKTFQKFLDDGSSQIPYHIITILTKNEEKKFSFDNLSEVELAFLARLVTHTTMMMLKINMDQMLKKIWDNYQDDYIKLAMSNEETRFSMVNYPNYKRIFIDAARKQAQQTVNEVQDIEKDLIFEIGEKCFTNYAGYMNGIFLKILKHLLITERPESRGILENHNLNNIKLEVDVPNRTTVVKCDELYVRCEEVLKNYLEECKSQKDKEFLNIVPEENIIFKNEKTLKNKKYRLIEDWKELSSIAAKNGFVYKRCRGDHGIFEHKDTKKAIVIPQGRDIDKGLSIQIQKRIDSYKIQDSEN